MSMTMENFCNTIKRDIQKELGDSFTISIRPTLKNNGTKLTGLVITEEGCNIAPTIYLDFYYEEYADGRADLKKVEQDILECYHSNKPQNSRFDLTGFTKWETAKSRLACKLVNYSDNQELLETTPHERFLDLAVICYYLVDMDCPATILIQDRFPALWGKDKNEVIQTAKENTFRLFPPNIRNMGDIIMELMGGMDLYGLDSRAGTSMYVLTSQTKMNGSIGILCPDLLKNFADEIQDDLYIIPSSIHEVLLVPAGETAGNGRELSEMVQEVNRTQVEREETLSDHVYFYSRETDRITM